MTKERPILLNGEMVRAVLNGPKTQTRRIVKPQSSLILSREEWHSRAMSGVDPYGCRPFGSKVLEEFVMECPYGKPGDRLWVRETFSLCSLWRPEFSDETGEEREIWYWADGNPDYGEWTKPKPSIHMPRELSRILLEITDVRVERLHQISANDALSEGVEITSFWTPNELEEQAFEEKWWDDFEFWHRYPQIVFRKLWNSIHGDGAWDLSPWVWVIEFKRVPS